MIKINLLDSVTDRARSVAAVEAQVANPRARTWLLAVVMLALTVLGMGVDWFSATSAYARAKSDLEREEAIAARMEAINKEQAELENKIKAIQTRIEAIKRLRASQRGPVAVLSALNERMPSIADFRLTNIEQKGGDLIVEGHSPNESAVTQFGRSLEFSSGLFSNVSIETERKELNVKKDDLKPGEVLEKDAPKPETVNFKITCKYSTPGSEAPAAEPAAADEKKKSKASATKDIAKK
ncbi:MAG TPA: PilN domain-containing protein [Pyrinomonadaceae bacterium]|jgi:Tfp pilus assembly protein PilN|nr:PilN domain-containing protein [Pyrinomonadaceae bacterium]